MRPLRIALMVISSLIVASSWGGAPAQTLGDARVGFSAERILVLNGRTYVGRMWHMPGEQRHEQDLPGIKPIFLLRAGSTLGDVVLPQLHTVIEFALPKAMRVLNSPDLLRHPVGQETVNGVATIKYAVAESFPEGHASGSLWLSGEGIPMKCEGRFEASDGKVSTVHWELRHVKIGNQDAALFEAPRGYATLPPEAAAPLLGLHLAPRSAR